MTEKTRTTHVLMIIDASGSMAPFRDDTIGSYNSYLDDLIKDEGDYRVTTTVFSSRAYINTIATAVPPNDPSLRLDNSNYRTMGQTALYDATGQTIAKFIDTNDELAPGDKVVVVSITDGAENDSAQWTPSALKLIISSLEKQGWTFVYLSQGFDGWQQASKMGYSANSYAGTHRRDGETISVGYGTASRVTRNVSRDGSSAPAADFMEEALGADQVQRAGD